MKRELAARKAEAKYNPNWRLQPRAPRGVRDGGRWVDGGAAKPASSPIGSSDINAGEGDIYDSNGIPTPGWAEPAWDYPAYPQSLTIDESFRMSLEAELAYEAILNALNAIEELNYRREMGRSVEDSYEERLVRSGVPYFRSVRVMTREGLRVYDFMQLGLHGWEFVEVKANRAVATPRQVRIDTAVQIFGFSIRIGPFRGIQGPANVRLVRSVPSNTPSGSE